MATQTINYDINVNAGGSVRTIQQMEQELNELNNEIKEVGVGSEAFKTAATNIQKLEKELNKANNAVEGFTLDKKLEAADGAIKVVAGSVAGLTGGLGLLGIQSESFDKLTAQASSAIAFGMGLKDVSEGYKQIVKSEAAAAIGAKLFGKATKTALIATGIGAFVVALGTVIAYWDEIVDYISDANGELETQNSLLEKQISEGEVQLELLRLNRNAAQLRGESEELIVEDIKKQLLLEQEQYKQLVDNLTIQLEREAAASREITLWEKIKIGAASAFGGVGAYAAAVADAVSPSEKVAELQERLNEARKGAATIDVQLAQLEKEKTDREIKAFDERQALDKKAIADEKVKADAEKARLQELADLKKEIRDAEANTVAEQRAKELEDLQLYYDNLILLADANNIVTDELKTSRDEAILALNQEFLDKDLAIKKAKADEEAALIQAGLDIKKQSLDTLAQLFGQETALGKAALIAKQAILLQELFINVKSTLSNAKKTVVDANLKAAGATADTASGLAKTSSSAPFPANIPLIIGYVAQAVGIISAVKSAVGAAKGVASTVGATGGGTPSITAPSAPSVSPGNINLGVSPETQVGNNAVQAYVISGDITSAQESEAKLNSRRQISG